MKNKSDFLLKLHSSAPAIFHRELLEKQLTRFHQYQKSPVLNKN